MIFQVIAIHIAFWIITR